MESKANQDTIDRICEYSQRKQVRAVLQEYLKRLVLERPEDPVAFLVKSIQENPAKVEAQSSWGGYIDDGGIDR